MNDENNAQRQAERAAVVARVCCKFEDDWQSGRRPRLEECLTECDDVLRDDLLSELIAIEIERRLGAGELPVVEEYVERFPDASCVVSAYADGVAAHESSHRRPSLPQRIGDFRVTREIGRGGMGVVYEAVQESLGRRVALKTLSEHLDPRGDRLRRFQREARAIARLHHSNIVDVFGSGQHDGHPFIAMRLIEGRGLDQLIDAGTATIDETVVMGASRADEGLEQQVRSIVPETAPADERSVEWVPSDASARSRQAAQVGQQIADALQYAHDQGVLHRDVKPSNILLDGDGTPWLADFGLAKVVHGDETASLTEEGSLLGTLRYMPPEHLHGEVDARGDIYSLGLALYELIALQPALAGGSRLECIENLRAGAIERLEKLVPDVPRDLATIIHKAIDREPAARYQTAGELADDLRRFLDDEPIRARRVSSVERFRRWSRRNRVLATALSAVFVLLALIAAGSTIAAVGFRQLNSTLTKTVQQLEARTVQLTQARNSAEAAVNDKLNDARVHQQLAEAVDVLAPDGLERRAQQFETALASAREAVKLAKQGQVAPELPQTARQLQTLLEGLAATARRAANQAAHDRAFDEELDLLRLSQAGGDKDALQLLRLRLRDANATSPVEAPSEISFGSLYERAFQQAGLDLANVSLEEGAAWIERSAIRESLITAIDNWIFATLDGETALLQPGSVAWTVLEPIELQSAGAPLQLQPDGSILAGAPAGSEDDHYTIVTQCPPTQIAALRLELLPDATLPSYGPGQHASGNVHLQEVRTFLLGDDGTLVPQRISRALATYAWEDRTVARTIDGNLRTEWHIFGQPGQPQEALFFFDKPISIDAPRQLVIQLFQKHDHALGRFRLSCRAADLRNVALNELAELVNAVDQNTWRKELRAAVLAFQTGRIKELAAGDEAMDQSPSLIAWLGAALRQAEANDESVAVLRRAQLLYPDDFWVNHELAESLLRANDAAEALGYARAAVAIRPRSAAALNRLAGVLKANGRRHEWLSVSRQVVALEPDNPGAYVALANALAEHGSQDEVIAALTTAVKLDPAQRHIHKLCDYLLQHRRAEMIATTYQEIAALHPDSLVVHYRFGHWLHRAGQTGAAIAAYWKAFELDPKFATADQLEGLTTLFPGPGNGRSLPGEIAVFPELLERLEDRFPGDGRLQVALAQALERAGNSARAAVIRSRARTLFEQRLLRDPDDVATAGFLADLLLAATVILPTSESGGAVWHSTTTKPSGDWMNEDFDDSSWNRSVAGFASRHDSQVVLRTSWTTPDMWLRRTFPWQGDGARALMFRVNVDDTAEIFLNGRKITKLPYSGGKFTAYPLDAGDVRALHSGTNTLAVHCHNFHGYQCFDMGIVEMPFPPDVLTALVQTKQIDGVTAFSDPWQRLAVGYHLSGDQAGVARVLESHPGAGIALGDIYAAEKDWEKAVATYGTVIDTNPVDSTLLAKRAEAYVGAEQRQLAEQDLLLALRYAPQARQTQLVQRLTDILSAPQTEIAWSLLQPAELESPDESTATPMDDGSLLIKGNPGDFFIPGGIPDSVQAVRVETTLPNAADNQTAPRAYQMVATSRADPAGGRLRGRFIRLDLPGENEQFSRDPHDMNHRMLNLAELQVFQGEQNIALHKSAVQSSILGGSGPDRAVDGETDSRKSHAHTNPNLDIPKGIDPWWELDLGSEQTFDRIVIWNRPDRARRMNYFRIRVLDDSRRVVFEQFVERAPNPTWECRGPGLIIEKKPEPGDSRRRLRLQLNDGQAGPRRIRVLTASRLPVVPPPAMTTFTDPWARLIATCEFFDRQSILDGVLKANPQAMAAFYAMQQNWELAIAEYNKTITDETKDTTLLAKRAEACFAAERWELAVADWKRAGQLMPDFYWRGFDTFRAAERWREAAELGLLFVDSNPRDSSRWVYVAPVLVQIDDQEYSAFCERMVREFAGPNISAADASRVCRAALLRSGAIEISELPTSVLNRFVENAATDHPWLNGVLAVQGLLAYRRGDAESAVRFASQCQQRNPMVFAQAINQAVLAMAQHQRGSPEEARQALRSAAQIVEGLEGALGKGQHDVLIGKILLDEAREAIGATEPPVNPATK